LVIGGTTSFTLDSAGNSRGSIFPEDITAQGKILGIISWWDDEPIPVGAIPDINKLAPVSANMTFTGEVTDKLNS